jgi:hypothetical protein
MPCRRAARNRQSVGFSISLRDAVLRRSTPLASGVSGSEFSHIKIKLDKVRRKDGRRNSRIPQAALIGSAFLEQSDGQPVKDLNDLLRIGTGSYRRNAKAVDSVMRF